MIGFLLGFFLGISYIGMAWNGLNPDFEVLPALASGGVILAIGVLVFPRTIGIALTPTSMLAPVAFVIAWIRLGLSDAFVVLLLGLGALIAAFLIGMLRPESTGRH